MDDLTDKQQRFVDEYIKDLNATQAGIRAGYSEDTAAQQASRLLNNVKVQGAISKAKEKLAKRTGITQDWVLENLVKLHDKCAAEKNKEHAILKALELIGKHLGMFSERVKLSNDNDKPFTTKMVHSVDERIAQMLKEEE